jgi:hypothetical protein
VVKQQDYTLTKHMAFQHTFRPHLGTLKAPPSQLLHFVIIEVLILFLLLVQSALFPSLLQQVPRDMKEFLYCFKK